MFIKQHSNTLTINRGVWGEGWGVGVVVEVGTDKEKQTKNLIFFLNETFNNYCYHYEVKQTE